ncbi:hypothetical protein D3C80_2092870 [compost metagenome]
MIASGFTYKPDRHVGDILDHFGSSMERLDDTVNAGVFAAELQLDDQPLFGCRNGACLGIKNDAHAQLLEDRPHRYENRMAVI